MTRLRSTLITAGIALGVAAVPVAAIALPSSDSTPPPPAVVVDQPVSDVAEVDQPADTPTVDSPAADDPTPQPDPGLVEAPAPVVDQPAPAVVEHQPAPVAVDQPAAPPAPAIEDPTAPIPREAPIGGPPIGVDEDLPEAPTGPLDTFDGP